MDIRSELTKESIDELAEDFTQNPWNYYTEPDLHAFLYCSLKQKLMKKKMLYGRAKDGEVNLLYREFPTKKKYQWTGKTKTKANFDLVILDDKKIHMQPKPKSKEDIQKLTPLLGIEIKLDVTDIKWEIEMKKCFEKLKEIEKSENRFIAFFARRIKFQYYDAFLDWVKERNENVQVKYVRVHPTKWKEVKLDNEWL